MREAAPGARILLVSTGEVYGDTGDEPAREDHAIEPRSPYAASKAAAEIAAGQAARAYGLDVVLARPFAHTGPGQDQRFALPSFAHQIAELERAGGGELKVGDLTVQRDLLDVRDVVAAYCALLEPAVPAGTYNVARGTSVPLSELVELLVAACSRAGSPQSRGVSTARSRAGSRTTRIGAVASATSSSTSSLSGTDVPRATL